MTDFEKEHVEVDAFDREYAIQDLLPCTLLEKITTGSAALWPARWAILTEKGAVHYRCGSRETELIENLTGHIDPAHAHRDVMAVHDGDVRIMFFPIEYELELKGYMAVWDSDREEAELLSTGRAGVHLLKQFIHLKHQTMLTSGLHGVVVKESYAELKEKAGQLARSEAKYRKLSANLEIEVQKKTEEIRTAHAHLMQHEKMAAIGQLSAGMAHEINNPLGFILSNLTTLKSYGDDLATIIGHYRNLAGLCTQEAPGTIDPAIAAQCKTAREIEQNLDGDFLLTDIPVLVEESTSGANRIKKIVTDLMTVARPGEARKGLINVHESIDAVLTIVQNRIGPKVDVHREFSPLSLLRGYPQEISQVWLNLILNALDALGGEGTLKIATQAARDNAIVRITDTGIGIAKEDLSKIFDPFFTTKEVGEGTGLGLHLSYHLIAKHGGRIEVKSQLGLGTTFTVFLPTQKG